MMKLIGITGGIGSGKSTVARIFESLGYPVYYADTQARGLMDTDPELVSSIRELLGEVYFENGGLDRAAVAKVIFADEAKREALNALVHPTVGRDFLRWAREEAAVTGKPLAFKEAAILFEAGADRDLHGVIEVYAPRELRLRRVMRRDEVNAEQVRARMDSQWPEKRKLMKADFVIYNDERQALTHQVRAALQHFTA